MIPNEKFREIEERVISWLDEYVVSTLPGLQYVVLDDNKVLFEYSGGFADVQKKRLMDGQVTMMTYSLTKTFTAAAIMQLFGQGKLDLDDPVEKYYPALPYEGSITIRQCLSHTAGIPNPSSLKWVHSVKDSNEFDEEDAFDQILGKHMLLKKKPGEKYLFSNIGYWILGKVIESVSRLGYQEYMRLNILQPIGLFSRELDFHIHDFSSHAKGYLSTVSLMNLFKYLRLDKKMWSKYEGRWLSFNPFYVDGPSYGGLISSARSISRFLHDQLQPKSVLFPNNIREFMYQRQSLNSGEDIPATLGWLVKSQDDCNCYYIGGGGAGFNSEMRIYPDLKLASVVMVNRTVFNTTSFLDKIDKEFINLKKGG